MFSEVAEEDVTMVMPPIHLRKDSGETGGRGVIERIKPLIKEMIPPQWRWEEKMQEPAGRFGGVVRNDSSSQLWRSMRTTHPRSQVIPASFSL